MSRPPRLQGFGALHHVIVRGNERKAVFRDDRDREEYLHRLARYRDRFGFSLYAYCLMTTHVHLAIEEGEGRLSKVMHALQSSYTQWFNRRWRRVGHLFQGRFKSFLVDRNEYLLALLRYIHENPVRARLVERPEDYAWSSGRFFRRGRGPAWLDLERVLGMLGPSRSSAIARYCRLSGSPPDTSYEDLEAIAGCVKGGEPFAALALREPRAQDWPRIGWNAERVARSVATFHGLSLEELRSRDRLRQKARVRIVAAYLGRLRFGMPVAEFARLFGREQSTLVRGVLLFERRLASGGEDRRKLALIEKTCLCL